MTYSKHPPRHPRFIIGQNIHHLRIRRNLPLAKLSRLAGVSQELLDRFERGKGDMRLEGLLRIARALKVGAEALLKDGNS